MNVDTNTKVLLKFGSLETVCVDVRPKKQVKLPHYQYMWILDLCMYMLSHMWTLNTLSLAYETL